MGQPTGQGLGKGDTQPKFESEGEQPGATRDNLKGGMLSPLVYLAKDVAGAKPRWTF